MLLLRIGLDDRGDGRSIFGRSKAPVFCVKNRKPGAFCISGPILICLQLLLPIFPKRVGAVATPETAKAICGEWLAMIKAFGGLCNLYVEFHKI